MKICQTCQQQFPNGFQYCPNDTDLLITSEEYFRRTKPLSQAPVAEAKLPPVTEPVPPPRPSTAEPPRTIVEEPTAALPFRHTESVQRREVLPSGIPQQRPAARPQPPADKPRNLAQPPQPVQTAPTQPIAPPSQELPRMNVAPSSQAQANGGQAHRRQAQPPVQTAQTFAPAAATLSFAIPESGGLLERLKNALRNYSDSFSKGGPPVRPGEMGDFRFLLREESLTARVGRELRNAGEDLKRDPKGFVVSTLRGEGSSKQRRRWLLNGTAMAVIAYSFLFFIIPTIALLMGWTKRPEEIAKEEEPSLEKLVDIAAIPLEAKSKDVQKELKNKAGGSKPKPQAAKGGGGGGRQQPTPASKGVPPQMALTPQIIPPNPEPPKIKNPSLVVASTVYGDPKALPQMKGPIGDPTAPPAPPSSGPGKGAGIGTGSGSGVGQGQGGGVGAGRGGNVGGGDMDLGGGRGGIEEMGRNGVGRPTILYKEKAKYTEEARQNKIQGTVVLSVIFTADGRITNVRVVRGLPDGLTEKAIEAAQRIRFQPATKNGGPVSVRGNLEFTFNLY